MARVLIVDGDEKARRFTSSILADVGHDLYFAKNGEEALRSFIRKGIELVVTELRMPNGSGFELIEAMQSMYPGVPVIAVSGAGREDLDMATMMGANLAFAKPVSPTALIKAVAELLPKGPRPRGGAV
jgi:DNA-binding NtrC family response regulator